MNYKKMSMRALLLSCVTVLFTGFASCGSSNDVPEPPSTEITGFDLTIDIVSTRDELAVGNVTIEYLDENGKVQTENITEQKWSKTIKYNKFPANVAYTIKHSMKEGIELSKDEYTLGMEIKPTCYVVFSDKTSKPSSQAFYGKSYTKDSRKVDVAGEFNKKNGVVLSTQCTVQKSENGSDIVAENSSVKW